MTKKGHVPFFSLDIYLPQTLNRYVYVVNNPVNTVDPTGESVVGIFFIVIMIVVIGYLVYKWFFTDEFDKLKKFFSPQALVEQQRHPV